MSSHILDASALLASLHREPGADQVEEVVARGEGAISAVNLSEVVSRLADRGMPEAQIRGEIDSAGLDVVPFDSELAYSAGLLRPATRRWGLSLGDRACLALARQRGLPAMTADRTWAELSLGVPIQVIR